MATKTTGNLLPGGVNTPLDARFAVDTLNDVEQMQNPVLGGIFYCKADGKHYKITELESKLVGAITVANAKVKSYEEFGGNPEEIAAINTSLAGLQSTVNTHGSLITDNKNAAANLLRQYNGLDTRMTAAEGNITGLNNLPKLSIVQSSTAPENPSNGTIWIPTESIAYSVLDLIAPDPVHVTDIPAWNTVYQATTACWISVSFLGGTTGGVMIGPSTTDLNGTPFGMWVGASGITGEYMTVFCPKGWYYQAHLENADATLSYSHKKVYKCKGA